MFARVLTATNNVAQNLLLWLRGNRPAKPNTWGGARHTQAMVNQRKLERDSAGASWPRK